MSDTPDPLNGPAKPCLSPQRQGVWGVAWFAWLCVGLGVLLFPMIWPAATDGAKPPDPSKSTQLSASLPCLSYAPFRRTGHTPMDPTLRLQEAALLEDLRLMAQWTGCIRTYGTDHGQDRIPALAAQLGLKVIQGAWVSRDRAASQQEVDTALALALAYPGTVHMVIVGNEVLLRQERSPQELALILRDARQRSPVPVAYADVWEFWLRHAPVLAPEVDVVAAHVLPYWEDVPVGLDRSVDHVLASHRLLQQAFPDRPIWIAETGWPAAGRQRGPAVPGPREQALFLRELRERLDAAGIDYNVIEAFDQPWKRQFEGAMGGAWGIADAQGRLRDPGAGPLPHDPRSTAAAWGLLFGGLTSWGLLALARRRASPAAGGPLSLAASAPPLGALSVLCVGATMGLLSGVHAAGVVIWLRDPQEWAVALTHGMLALGVCGRALWRAARETPGNGGLAWPGTFEKALLFLTAWEALTLVFDARYRPLHAGLVGAAAIGLWVLRAAQDRKPADPSALLLALVLAAAAPVLLVMEGWANTQAVALCAGWLLMAAAVGVDRLPHFLLPHQRPNAMRP